MKKFLICFLSVVMLFSLCSCANNGKEGNDFEHESSAVNDSSEKLSNESTTSDDDKSEDVQNEITIDDVLNHPVSPESDFKVKEKDNGCCEIVKYTGDSEIIVIPEEIEGFKVVGIYDQTFNYDNQIVGIKLADSIEYIGENVFVMAEKLKYLVCGDSLTTIDEYAFFKCPNLSSVKLNDGLITLGGGTFSMCDSLNEIFIPESVNEMSTFSFMPDDFVVKGVSGSYAEKFALENGMKFVAVP